MASRLSGRRIWTATRRYYARLSHRFRKLWNGTKGFFAKKRERRTPTCDSTFHKEKIMMLGNTLKNRSLPMDERAQAAQKIGLLAFTGGPGAGQFASGYMKDVAHLMQNEDMNPKSTVQMLQGLACWCYLNPASQRKASEFRFIPILLGFFDSIQSTVKSEINEQLLIQFWTCYALSAMSCNNLPIIRELREFGPLNYHLRNLAKKNWSGWPENFAEVLYYLVGFHKT